MKRQNYRNPGNVHKDDRNIEKLKKHRIYEFKFRQKYQKANKTEMNLR